MSTRKIVSNTIYYGVVPKLTLLVSVLILPLTTPYLSTFDYGIQGIVTSYTSLIAMLAPLGLNMHLTNSYYEYPKKYQLIWGRILFSFLVSGALFGVINFLILATVLPFVFSWELVLICFIGSFQVLLFANALLAQHLFPLVERPKPLVFGNLLASCVGIFVSFVLIYFFRQGYWGLISSMAVSSVVSFLIFIKYVWVDYKIYPIIERNWKRLSGMLKVALPLVPHSLGFVLLTSSARIVMTWHNVPYGDIGLFSHGCSMGEYILVIPTALTTAIVPQMQTAYRMNDFLRYRKLYYLCQSVALLSSAMICIWMGDIYSILIRNEQLSQSSEIAMLMCFANVVYPFYCFMSTPVFILKNTKQLLWLVFLPGFLNIILCCILIPIWGFKIAIFSTMISYWSQLLIPIFVKYYAKIVGDWLGRLSKLFSILLILVIVVIFSNYIGHLSVPYKIGGSFFFGSCFMIYYYNNNLKTAYSS